MLLASQTIFAQVELNANGPGDTYELINSVLAPGYDVTETPDCIHTSFGRHIDEFFDTNLNTNVFRFYIHLTPDNDRCTTATDRQRNEIKVYDKSPSNLKAVEGEIVVYKWKFKLPTGFQSSSSFTHIHQLKSVGGLYEATPMYTLTTRKGTPDQLELRYAQTSSQSTLKKTDLTPFKGTWVDVTETITYGTNGSYSILIKRVSDNTELFNYSSSNIVNWQTGADFVRPKWGIYRSLNTPSDLRDEEVLFANFSIEEIGSLSAISPKQTSFKIYPNPADTSKVTIQASPNSFDSIYIYNNLGKLVNTLISNNTTIDTTNLKSGIYLIVFKKNGINVSSKKLVVL
ncbi:T9SS type A sorting domain-containing protein [Mariniflexile jejuense]|uniref:T9SS type A sorting domain-containing protein n=1 Tax=Mariniflexile jejuense TaxID=1173582 RepID=A0ABW3JK73_9FLAO